MYLSIHENVNVPTITFLADPPRDDWNFEVRFGSSRRVAYVSYEELKSAWFAISAALSEYEDENLDTLVIDDPVPFLPTFPPAIADFLREQDERRGLIYDPSFGYFTEMGGKAHIARPSFLPDGRPSFSLCGLRLHSGHPRREGETPCGNCRTIALAAAPRPAEPSHRETRPKVDGVFALEQDVCLERLARHEWRWGIRSVDGDRAVTRRYCVNCGTFFGDGGAS